MIREELILRCIVERMINSLDELHKVMESMILDDIKMVLYSLIGVIEDGLATIGLI